MRIVFTVIIVIIFFSCNSKKDGTGKYTIKATIAEAIKGDTVICRLNGKVFKADTFIVEQNNTVFFEGNITEPTPATIYFPSSFNETQSALTVFVEPTEILVNGNKNKLQNSTVKGGVANADMQKVNAITNKYNAEMQKIGNQLKILYDAGKVSELKNLEQEYMELGNKATKEIELFIVQSPKSYAAAYIAFELFGYAKEAAKIETIYNNYDATIKESNYGKKLKAVLDALQITKIGSIAPNFTLNTVDGKPISVSNFKGKYLLLDFWASWCGPCRMENPNVVAAYNKFKNKNLAILGVSLDEDKQQWMQAIAKDNLPWTHISDLKGWQSPAASLYNVQSIPANFLIDPYGKIIAKNLNGKQLEVELSNILK